MKRRICLALLTLLSACGGRDPDTAQYGSAPPLPDPEWQLLPTMKIAKPAEWGDRRPVVPQGYAIAAIATDCRRFRSRLFPARDGCTVR